VRDHRHLDRFLYDEQLAHQFVSIRRGQLDGRNADIDDRERNSDQELVKKYLIGLIAVFGLVCLAPKAQAANYTYYRSITVTSTASVASGTNANFPMLVSSTLSSWEPVSKGGHIQNLVTAPNGGTEPADLIFVTSTPTVSGTAWSCGTSLNFETQSYSSSTGALMDWVNVPSVSTGTVIYACYGASSVTTDQSHPSSTWNSNYIAVYHFPAVNGLLVASDSTSNANNLSATGSPSIQTGILGGGIGASTSNYFTKTLNTTINTVNTVSAWVFASSSFALQNYAGQVTGGAEILSGDATNGGNSNKDAIFGSSFVFGTAYATGTWYYVSQSRNGTGANSYISYVNGVAVITTTRSSNDSGTGLTIGVGSSHTEPWPGIIDEFRVSNIANTSQWILTEYNNQSSPSAFYTLGSETAVSAGTIHPRNTILTWDW